jgi:exopolysaccharide biosynthesis protein
LDARLDPALLTSFQSTPGNRVQSVRLEAGPDRTTLRLAIPISQYPQVTTLANPNRLIIDFGNEAPNRDILWAPGLRWRQQMVTLGADRFPVNWFEVNLNQPGLSIQPLLPPTGAAPGAAGTATLFGTAQKAQAVAAVNGGFFNRNEQLPLGAVRINGQWRAGPILNRGAVAWNPGGPNSGEWRFERLATQEAMIVAGQRQPLTTLNSAYVQAGIARYTPEWGPTYSPMSDSEVIMTVQNGRVIAQQTMATAKASSPVSIPNGSYLLVFRRNQTLASTMPVGTALQLESALLPDLSRYQTIIGGGPLLVQNRQIVANGKGEGFSDAFVQERAARSAIGRSADGTVLIVAVHDRIGGRGPSLEEMAQLMQQLGCIDALNLDGGSSTTLYLGGQILDRPARSSARVHNAIGIFLQPTP